MEDEKIIELFWAREQSALAETQRKYGALCQSIAYGVLRDREDALECVNDTWLAAWNAIPPARPRLLPAFLGTITRNLSVSRLRENCQVRRGGGVYPAVLDELAECLSDGDTPERALERRELVREINAFLASLSPEERKIFLCRYWLLASTAETAEALACTQAKVKTSLHRTRKKLQRHLQKEGLL